MPPIIHIPSPARELYAHCWSKWGQAAQLNILQEECAELIKEASKILRGAIDSKFAEEVADVYIMLQQVVSCMKIESKVHKEYTRKIKRLIQRANWSGNVKYHSKCGGKITWREPEGPGMTFDFGGFCQGCQKFPVTIEKIETIDGSDPEEET